MGMTGETRLSVFWIHWRDAGRLDPSIWREQVFALYPRRHGTWCTAPGAIGSTKKWRVFGTPRPDFAKKPGGKIGKLRYRGPARRRKQHPKPAGWARSRKGPQLLVDLDVDFHFVGPDVGHDGRHPRPRLGGKFHIETNGSLSRQKSVTKTNPCKSTGWAGTIIRVALETFKDMGRHFVDSREDLSKGAVICTDLC